MIKDMKLWAIDWEQADLRQMCDEDGTNLHIVGEDMADVMKVIYEQWDDCAIIDIRNIRYVGTVSSKYFPDDGTGD